MTHSTLAYLNRLLVDYLGKTPAGGPLFKWFHSRDPEMFIHVRLGSAGASYERMPMIWEDRWVMGAWQAPEPKDVWDAKYRGELPYPRRGYYVPCSIPSELLLQQGVEPNERITMYAIEARRDQLALRGDGILQTRRDQRAKKKAQKESEADALLSQAWQNFEPKVPGARELLAEN